MDNDEKSNLNKALHFIMSQAELNGVGAVAVNDGYVFVLSKAMLQKMMDAVEESKEDRCILFVKHGGAAESIEEN